MKHVYDEMEHYQAYLIQTTVITIFGFVTCLFVTWVFDQYDRYLERRTEFLLGQITRHENDGSGLKFHVQ